MLNKSLILIALLGTGTQAEAQARQFDLVCVSKYHDATFHYRVDLDAAASKTACRKAQTQSASVSILFNM